MSMNDNTGASDAMNGNDAAAWVGLGGDIANNGARKPDQEQARDKVDLEMLQDVPVTLSLELGRTQISIRNLLQLNQGSVVELDTEAGQPMDILVNGRLVAHGEVVVVNEKLGVRVTDVMTPAERVQRLR